MPQELSAQFPPETSSRLLASQGSYVEGSPSSIPLLEHCKCSYSSFRWTLLPMPPPSLPRSISLHHLHLFQSLLPSKSKTCKLHDFRQPIFNRNMAYSDRKNVTSFSSLPKGYNNLQIWKAWTIISSQKMMSLLNVCVCVCIYVCVCVGGASQVALVVKNPPAMQETWETQIRSLGWEDPLEKGMQPTPVVLPGEFHWQRSLVVYSPWSAK